MNMKTISIIIPVYNVAKYIKRCLDSICTQTYNKIECILVDDCGNDDSMSIVEEYVKSYQGEITFKILYHSDNKGQATARNTGIRAATGDFILFIDSDDAITSDCIQTLLNLSEKYPNAEFIQANTVTGNNKELMPYTFKEEPPEFCDNKLELDRLILASLTMTVWNRLIKRSFLIDHQLLFPDGILCEDMYWIYFLAKEVKSAAFTSHGTYLYYRNSNSDANSMSRKSRFRHYQGQMVAVKAFFEDIKHTKTISIYQRQYLAGNLVATMGNLAIVRSLNEWINFWSIVCNISWYFRSKITISRIILFISLMPPLCFLAGYRGWMWRLKQHVVSKT